MRYLILLLSTILFFSCKKEEAPFCSKELICKDESCLFTINNALGTTMHLSCFDQWGLISKHPISGEDIWLIKVGADGQFEEADLNVRYCGYVKENTFPLLLPDPSIGPVYELHVEDIRLEK